MRDVIFERALELFSERGFDGASMRELAKRSGTTPSNVYNYFESKEELLREVFRTGAAQIRETLEADVEDDDLRGYLAGVLRTVDENRSLWRMIHQLRLNEDVSRILDPDFRTILAETLAGLERFSPKPWLLLAIVDGVVASRLQGVPHPPSTELVHTIATCLEALDDR